VSQAWTALLGAVVGGLASVSGVIVGGRASRTFEIRRQQEAVRRESAERLRLQVVEVLRLMFATEYAIYSICWFAKHLPGQVDAQRISAYDANLERLLPELSGALVVLSSMDPDTHRILNQWSERIETFDGAVRKRMYLENNADALEQLAGFVEPVQQLYKEFPSAVGSFLYSRKVTADPHDARRW